MSINIQPVPVPTPRSITAVASPWKGAPVVQVSIASNASRGLTQGTHELYVGSRAGDFANRSLYKTASLDAAITGAQIQLGRPVQRGANPAQAILQRDGAFYFGGLHNADGQGAEMLDTRKGVKWLAAAPEVVGVVLGKTWVPLGAQSVAAPQA